MHDQFTGAIDGLAPVTAAAPTSIRVVGLDLSLTGTGVATISEGGIQTALIKSKGKRDDSLKVRAARLAQLRDQITNLIPERALVVIEGPSYGSTTGSHHDRSGFWWLIVDYLAPFNQVVEVAPGTLKKYATNSGTAGKDEMLAAAIRRYPGANIVNNNVADSMHLCAMGARYLGQPLEADTIKILEAMDTPRWDA